MLMSAPRLTYGAPFKKIRTQKRPSGRDSFTRDPYGWYISYMPSGNAKKANWDMEELPLDPKLVSGCDLTTSIAKLQRELTAIRRKKLLFSSAVVPTPDFDPPPAQA